MFWLRCTYAMNKYIYKNVPLHIHTHTQRLPSFTVLSNKRYQSSFQERIHCFIWPHQKKAASAFKMKIRNLAFTVESRRVVRKKRVEENSECDQTLCDCKSSILGREAMSQSFCSCTKPKKNILVTECCWLNDAVATTDPCLLNVLADTFMSSLILLSVWRTSYIDVLKITGKIASLCICISLSLLLIQHNTEFRWVKCL